ncbi:MAG: aminotransferase class I/II-fold pyridoxal phosphate-dependent enzyme [Proteobacteria bacterium]|nr:aminotransferase class I/II-fold pyridoxal phosphate-dependent enzyme [Pseudomonadota bacterium]
MGELRKFLVPWIDDVQVYSTDDLLLAWADPEIGRMMLNENPLGPSERVVKAVQEAARLGNRYPDTGPRLRQKIGKFYGLGPDNVYLGNGSSEMIDNIMRLFVAPGDEVIIPNPAFSLFKVRVTTAGGKPILVDMKRTEEGGLQYDTEAMLKAVTSRTKVFIICTPNNPSGDFIPEADLIRFLDTGIPVFIDEAYLEYHPDHPSNAPLIQKYSDNAMVSHTMSKAFGMAGIRFGYLLASEEMVGYLRKIQLPWSLGLLSLAAGEAAWDEREEELKEKVEFNRREIGYIWEELSGIEGIHPFHSYGNYILVDPGDTALKGKDVVDFVFQETKIMIKTYTLPGGRQGFRLSLGNQEQNRACVGAIKKFFETRASRF